jgi:hypothetical protein
MNCNMAQFVRKNEVRKPAASISIGPQLFVHSKRQPVPKSDNSSFTFKVFGLTRTVRLDGPKALVTAKPFPEPSHAKEFVVGAIFAPTDEHFFER